MNQERFVCALYSSPLWLSPERPRPCPCKVPGVDVVWYWRTFRKNRESSFAPVDCLPDYIENAGSSYRSPNLAFDEFWYRTEYPDVEELIARDEYASGWQHYLDQGARKQYNPVFWFNERWYQNHHLDAAFAVRNRELACAFEHYLLYGIRQDYSPSMYFNVRWYRERYMKDVQGGDRSCPIVHYLLSDPAKRPCPVPFFDSPWYLSRYFTGAAENLSEALPPFEHYILFGRKLGYSPSPYFDEAAYRGAYPAVMAQITKRLYSSGFEHYATEGPVNGFVPQMHLNNAGLDYSGPEFIRSYEQSLLLNLSQLKNICDLAQET